jgi:hypothetical protein
MDRCSRVPELPCDPGRRGWESRAQGTILPRRVEWSFSRSEVDLVCVGIPAMPIPAPLYRLNQPDALVISQRVSRHPATFGHCSDGVTNFTGHIDPLLTGIDRIRTTGLSQRVRYHSLFPVLKGHDFSRAESQPKWSPALAAEGWFEEFEFPVLRSRSNVFIETGH